MPILGAPEVMASSERQRWFDPGGGGSTHGGVLGVQTRKTTYVCNDAMKQNIKSGVTHTPIIGTTIKYNREGRHAMTPNTNPSSEVRLYRSFHASAQTPLAVVLLNHKSPLTHTQDELRSELQDELRSELSEVFRDGKL